MVILFDLVTRDDLRPSPFCWRAKLALKHKRVPFEARAILFSEIPKIGDGAFKTVPVIKDGTFWSGGSFKIAADLEARYPDTSTLFPNDPQKRFVEFVESYIDTLVHPMIFPSVALNIWEMLPSSEKDYFRRTREHRLGMTLEDAHQRARLTVAATRASLDPVRRILKQKPFLSGDSPAYADYIVFGAIKWHCLVSDAAFIEAGDSLSPWFERIDAIACS